MSDADLDRLAALLAAALELPAAELPEFLERECSGDPRLRRELSELLAAHRSAEGYFEGLAGEIATGALLELDAAARPKVQIGPYRASTVVGRGGMGVVYLAERADGQFTQQVAIKLLHLDMESPQLRARFLAERQLLARLAHPGIARLLDGGVTDEGRPYFVMDYVEGVPITTYCRSNALPVGAILRLFLDVIEAVSYLHRNLVVHRDLKPSNILVDGSGRAKLLDFGIAKLLAEDHLGADRTSTEERLLTPGYAAPEQLTGDSITTATDVYSLGTVLYELLSGCKPHPRRAGDPLVPPTGTPVPPSAALRAGEAGADGEEPPPAHSWRRIQGDLDDICSMALRPEPEQRYASAEQLGEDIRRHLEERPTQAGKGTFVYRVTRFGRRNRRSLTAALLVLAVLAVGYLHERGLRNEAELAHERAQSQAAKAVAVSEFLGELLSSADPSRAQGEVLTVSEVLNQAAERLEGDHALVDQPEAEASLRLTLGETYTSLREFGPARRQLEHALRLREELGLPELEILEVIEALAVARYREGDYSEAELLLERVLSVRTRELGEDHPETLRAMSHLANVYWFQERFDQVEALDRKTLESRQRVLGLDHPDTLRSMNALATTLFSRARYAQAAELFERALAAQRRQLGESHPDTLQLMNNLAAAYTEMGRYREAEPMARAVAEGRRRVLGARHPETGTALHNLALNLIPQARYDEAETLLLEAIDIRREDSVPSGLLFSQSYLADIYREQGRYDEAEELYRSVLERQGATRGPEDAQTLRTASSLAALHLRRGGVAAAKRLITSTLDSQRKVLDPSHPDLLGSQIILARVHNAQRDFDPAESLIHQTIEAGKVALAPDHPLVLEAVEVRTEALRGLGRVDDARALAQTLYRDRERVLGAKHPWTLAAGRLNDELRDGED